MQYHIETGSIHEAFSDGCDCPLCKIQADVEGRLLHQYLSDAVMEPSARVEVNKHGFCAKHLEKLFENKNKLGLSLQLETRLGTLRQIVSPLKNAKQAQKQAAELNQTMEDCVICRALTPTMERYAYTTAQLYANEPEFAAQLKKCTGFCLPHYVLLLEQSKKAGAKADAFVQDLSYVQGRAIDRTRESLDRFAQKFDYRNAGSGAKPDPETVPAAIRRLKGRIV